MNTGMTTLHNNDRIDINWKVYLELESRIVRAINLIFISNPQLTLLGKDPICTI